MLLWVVVVVEGVETAAWGRRAEGGEEKGAGEEQRARRFAAPTGSLALSSRSANQPPHLHRPPIHTSLLNTKNGQARNTCTHHTCTHPAPAVWRSAPDVQASPRPRCAATHPPHPTSSPSQALNPPAVWRSAPNVPATPRPRCAATPPSSARTPAAPTARCPARQNMHRTLGRCTQTMTRMPPASACTPGAASARYLCEWWGGEVGRWRTASGYPKPPTR